MPGPNSSRPFKAARKSINKGVGAVGASGGYGEHAYNMAKRPSGYLDGAKAIPGVIRPPRVTEGAPAPKQGMFSRMHNAIVRQLLGGK
jgi:hypothetical protein